MIRTSSVLFWFSLIIIASLALYRTSDRVHELNTQLRQVNADIESEQQSIHVLKAEWVYLANPARVEAAAHKHLTLRPTSPQQVTDLSSLSEVLPTRSEAMASVAISGTPIANIRSNMEPMPTRPTTVAVVVKHAAPIALASVDAGHINDHMIMQRTASAAPTPDSIGTLITELGANQ